MPDLPVTNHPQSSRFELSSNGHTAVLEYKLRQGSILFIHTEVPADLEGRGIGAQLAKAGLAFARENKLSVIPLCPFVAGYIKRHPEYLDLVPPEHHARVQSA